MNYASGLDTDDPKCSVSILGCTGDWFGGWDGLTPGSVDQFITEDLKGGRLPQVIDRGEPAILVCHWPGIYYNGEELGFNIFKEIVARVHARNDNLVWMKLSEIARYWAAKELTAIAREGNAITLSAPYACPAFTIEIPSRTAGLPRITSRGEPVPLAIVKVPLSLNPNTFTRTRDSTIVCFDLPKGKTRIEV